MIPAFSGDLEGNELRKVQSILDAPSLNNLMRKKASIINAKTVQAKPK
jgi:hypothetical protein